MVNTSFTRDVQFPALPLEEWEDTKSTLHLFLQVVGKVRLSLHPKMNHWWHVPFYVSVRGLTTGSIPYEDMTFEMEFNFRDSGHTLKIETSEGDSKTVPLKGLSVAGFYEKVFSSLNELGIVAGIRPVPYDIPGVTEPFVSDYEHASYDEEYVNRFWRILVQVDSVFKVFRGWFTGKGSPVHFFWHHADLAFTLFSGRSAPVREGANPVEREASSHEMISFGFWAGDRNVREPAFYAYVHPQPQDIMDERLSPEEAFWSREAGEALLMYEYVRNAADSPQKAILDFLESVYQAGAKRTNWNIGALRLPSSEKQFEG
ncbi:hypothetical protein MSHOH_1769 [Methanosarcina horonobensis HB-1 = JCM 15518]|uniref:Uncharacterized protein n=1 Tax=Methanosarcina horonobensis HB-1 = JCM 15518 TaxID=1434110 RepID=A0A0E3SDR1_9EURY|nr:DUF5996 family protein [Methanosarcina horonobensis]AKB78252.1 hypothetical protein MSHOH_1769 [Methanosarcina horonobensis HB-1 = JCM 15518]